MEVYWGNFRCSRAANSVVSGPIWPEFEYIPDTHFLLICNFKKDQIRSKATEATDVSTNKQTYEWKDKHYIPVGINASDIIMQTEAIYEPRHEKTNVLVSDTNQAVQLQKMARGLKFWIQ